MDGGSSFTGVNALRTSHNAAASEVLEMCDRMGVIVFNELFGEYGPTAGVPCSTADYVVHLVSNASGVVPQ